MKKAIYIFTLLTFTIYSCTNTNETTNEEKPKPTHQEMAAGFQLLETSCFTCHNPNTDTENAVAPSMISVKSQYVTENTTQEQFTNDFIAFMNNPSVEKSKMPDAIKQYNLMPKMSFSEEQYAQLAAYIYHSEIQKPEWFEKQYNEEKLKYASNHTDITPIELGQKIAMQTKGVIGKNLLGAIKSGGPEYAVSFCSTRAIPLTDSMAIAQNTQIKRVSDKNRNPINAANEAELNYIIAAKAAMARGDKPKPQLTKVGDKHLAYYPITTDQMCMQCHGKVLTDISANTLAKINSLYPKDKATDYKVDELRGIWVIEMDSK